MLSSLTRREVAGILKPVMKNALRSVIRQIIKAKKRGNVVPRVVVEDFMELMKQLYPQTNVIKRYRVFLDIVAIHSPHMYNNIISSAMRGPESEEKKIYNRIFNHVNLSNNARTTIHFNLDKLLRSHNINP